MTEKDLKKTSSKRNDTHLLELFCIIICISIVSILAYYSSLENNFAFDDNLAIVNNKDTLPTSPFAQIWSNDIWGKDLKAIDSHRSYRPLLITLFKYIRIFSKDSGGASTFRVISIALHITSSVLVYILSRTLLNIKLLAWGAAMLFAAHPAHIEAVAAVVNMAEAIHSIFYMAMFLIYYRSVRRTHLSRIIQIMEVCCWLLFLVVSVLFKETGLTVVGIILAHSSITLLRSCTTQRHSRQSLGKHCSHEVMNWISTHGPWIFVCGLAIILYILLRMMTQGYSPVDIFRIFASLSLEAVAGLTSCLNGTNSTIAFPSLQTIKSSFYLEESQLIRKAENPFAFLQGRQEKILSFMYLHFRYFYVLLYPAQLCAEYAFNCIPSVSELSDPRNVYSALLYVGLGVAGIAGLHSAVRGKENDDPGTLAPRALLDALFWMIIPFIPASGVLLRLGTLLAERLLYVPSIGYCMLQSLCLHVVSMALSLGSQWLIPGISSSSARIIKSSVYVLAVVGICACYCYKTSDHSKVWRDDDTLFVQSLHVCPNSAKLQLQAAKLLINQGNYSAARFHVDRAAEIDPTFCDIGYQDALVTLFLERDMAHAMELAADNLECVFTNMNSWELLNKLWEQQLIEAPNNPHVLAMQGDIASRGKMHAFACKKYNAAVTAAFDAKQYSVALENCIKAEALVPKFMKDAPSGDYSGNALAIRDLACFVYLLGGATRAHIQELIASGSKSSPQLPSKLIKQLRNSKDLLSRAMKLECIILDGPGPEARIVGSNAMAAARSMGSFVNPRIQIPYPEESFVKSASFVSAAAALEDYARYLQAAAELELHVANHRGISIERPSEYQDGRQVEYHPGQSPKEHLQQVPDMRLMAIYLWSLLGRHAFGKEDFANAAKNFQLAMQWGVGKYVTTPAQAWFLQNTTSPTEQNRALLSTLTPTTAPCSSLYWLVHALGADDAAWTTAAAVQRMIELLESFMVCEDQKGLRFKSSEEELRNFRAEAKLQLVELRRLPILVKNTLHEEAVLAFPS